ncbi:MAG: PHP domain-containing protein [Clostridia bacterium]|nr:PHP domain-containing protein [Clostridia bacterium]
MKLPNYDPSVFDYEIFPAVVRLGEKTAFSLGGCGMDCALTPGKTYYLRFIGQEENNSSLILDISDWTRYDGLETAAGTDGRIRFEHSFFREQIYTVRLAEKDEKGNFIRLSDLRIFCAKNDLYERTPMRGNTHCHACPSVDGHEDPFLAAAHYRKAGFDFLAITDHHLLTGSALAKKAAKSIPNGMLLFYGEEVHVPNAYIHAVNIGAAFPGEKGLNSWYLENKDRCGEEVRLLAEKAKDALPENVEPMDYAWRRWIADKIHEKGGAAILAHPFWEWDAHNTRDDVWRFLAKEKIYDAVEALHGQEPGCRDSNMEAAFWNELRSEGIYISPLGADDAHRRYHRWDYECSFNEVYSIAFLKEKSLEGFKEALKSGFTCAVESYQAASERVTATYRLTKYALFLLDRYFPLHDELCFEEGRLMRDAYLGDENAVSMLKSISGRIERLNKRFFGR